MESETYDVAIIGGGPAGLSAALVLGRARRRVVVVDAGAPRNAPAAHMQGFLSRDGTSPAELLQPREPRSGATAWRSSRTASSTRPPASRSGSPSGRTVEARQVLLATGAVDELPDVDRRPRALGPRSPALPVLPRLGGARPADRRARDRPGVRRARTSPAPMDGRRDPLHAHARRHARRAGDARRPWHRGRRRDGRAPRRRRRSPASGEARRRPQRRARRALHPTRAARARRTGPPQPSAASCSREGSSGSTPTAARACPASGRRATQPTRARR